MKKYIKQFIRNLKYDLGFLRVLNSPFVGLKLTWYFGKIQHGTPYFLPRKWVKCDMNDALNAWDKLSDLARETYTKSLGKNHYIENYIKSGYHTKPIPIKYFGFHFTTLGWKTKWDDYRFEWNPSLSIVLFGKQIFISILPKVDGLVGVDSYWESWLNYDNCTDKSKLESERVKELREKHSCTWSNYQDGKEIKTDYYNIILKTKYR